MSDDEHEEGGPTEAELALQRRRQGGTKTSKGLTDVDKELLATNKEDRKHMDDEIQELRQRAEKRKKEREIEEKRLATERAAEEERRKAAEDEKRKKKEEEERKRKEDRAKKMAEFDKFKNPTGPNFVISRRAGGGGGDEEGKEGKKSKEQLEAEKKAILKQRIVPLNVSGLDQSGLAEKAKELHKTIYRLEGEKYDLEKRFKTQQIDMQELAERARQANKVGKEGLKRTQITEGESDIMQERFAGTPCKVEMFSKYERQKDKRDYKERKNIYTGPQYIQPPERIKPSKFVRWNEGGMPTYDECPEGPAPPPAAAAEAGGEE